MTRRRGASRRDMNFSNVSSQRAQDLAPLPRLFTDEDRRVHRRRQRRLAIAEKDVEALVLWRGGYPQDIVDERQFYKQLRSERDARRRERAAYREDKRSRKQATQLKLKLRETAGCVVELSWQMSLVSELSREANAYMW